MATARTATHAFLPLEPMHSLMYRLQIHYSVTPRSRATSSRVRNNNKPWMVAFTRLIGLVLPWVLVKMFRMPHASKTSRTPGPAFTPVPGPAGTRTTRLLPNRPIVLIAHDNEGIEAETSAALDHRGATPNLHHALFDAVLSCFPISSHEALPMEDIILGILAQLGKILK